MINELLTLLITAILFCILAYGMIYICERFGVPPPIRWICAGILLIVLIVFAANLTGLNVRFPALR